MKDLNKRAKNIGIWFKGTVSVISSERPPCKDGNDRFTTLH